MRCGYVLHAVDSRRPAFACFGMMPSQVSLELARAMARADLGQQPVAV